MNSLSVVVIGKNEEAYINDCLRSALDAVRYCFFNCGDPWTLTHSKNQEVLQVIYRGDLFLTRLEGEWCTRFQNE